MLRLRVHVWHVISWDNLRGVIRGGRKRNINFSYTGFEEVLQRRFSGMFRRLRNFTQPSFNADRTCCFMMWEDDSITLLLLFLLGLLLLSFVHAALQILHGVQQLIGGLQERVDFSAHFVADGIFARDWISISLPWRGACRATGKAAGTQCSPQSALSWPSSSGSPKTPSYCKHIKTRPDNSVSVSSGRTFTSRSFHL